MAFPSMNANHHASINTGALKSDTYNWFRTPAVVDCSGMEFSFAFTDTHAAASASVFTVAVHDGGSAGTSTGVILGAITNSPSSGTAWTSITPRSSAGTTTTDLDADDFVNLVTVTGGTAASDLTVMVSYVYGKPAVIN